MRLTYRSGLSSDDCQRLLSDVACRVGGQPAKLGRHIVCPCHRCPDPLSQSHRVRKSSGSFEIISPLLLSRPKADERPIVTIMDRRRTLIHSVHPLRGAGGEEEEVEEVEGACRRRLGLPATRLNSTQASSCIYGTDDPCLGFASCALATLRI